jgi:hypothetical protein
MVIMYPIIAMLMKKIKMGERLPSRSEYRATGIDMMVAAAYIGTCSNCQGWSVYSMQIENSLS